MQSAIHRLQLAALVVITLNMVIGASLRGLDLQRLPGEPVSEAATALGLLLSIANISFTTVSLVIIMSIFILFLPTNTCKQFLRKAHTLLFNAIGLPGLLLVGSP